MISRRLVIKGKVQGVFYRQSALETARRLALNGYVQNLANGDVLAVVTGQNEMVDAFITWCRQGPTRAIVDEVQVEDIPVTAFEDFSIRR